MPTFSLKNKQGQEFLSSSTTSPQQQCLSLVAISDLHNGWDRIKFPSGQHDILLICGDVSDRGSMMKYKEFNEWMGKQKSSGKFKEIVMIAGNHDYGLDHLPMAQKQKMFCNAIYLEESSAKVLGYHFYGFPHTYCRGMAFPQAGNMQKIVDKIPKETEILLTHNPAFNILDLAWVRKKGSSDPCPVCNRIHPHHRHWGCKFIRHKLLNTNHLPNLFIHCTGHVHDDGGEHRVLQNQLTGHHINFLNAASKWTPFRAPIVFRLPKKPKSTTKYPLYYAQMKKTIHKPQQRFIIKSLHAKGKVLDFEQNKDGRLDFFIWPRNKKRSSQQWYFSVYGELINCQTNQQLSLAKNHDLYFDSTSPVSWWYGQNKLGLRESHHVLDLDCGRTKDGSRVIGWKNNGQPWQAWTIAVA